MNELVKLEIVLTKAEAKHLMDIIAVGNDNKIALSNTHEAIDDIHSELYEATDSGNLGFQNRLVISPSAFPLYQRGK